MTLETVTLAQRPDLEREFGRAHQASWPTFMLHDPISNRTWHTLHSRFAEFQFLLLEGEDVVAIGNTMPVRWDGSPGDLPDGVDGVLVRTVDANEEPSVLSAMAAIVAPGWKGRGVSPLVLQEMRRLARGAGLRCLIGPVRPTLKDRYPLILMEDYMQWRREDGSHFDPWLRVHERLGARILGVADRSMKVPGPVAQWEAWSGMTFPGSGRHIVPGALSPVDIDLERDQGIYAEQNVWMQHP